MSAEQLKLELNPDYKGAELIDIEHVLKVSTMRIFTRCIHNLSENAHDDLKSLFNAWKPGDKKEAKQASHKLKGTWS